MGIAAIVCGMLALLVDWSAHGLDPAEAAAFCGFCGGVGTLLLLNRWRPPLASSGAEARQAVAAYSNVALPLAVILGIGILICLILTST